MRRNAKWCSLAFPLIAISCTGGGIISSEPSDSREAIGQYAIPKAVIEVVIELKYPKTSLGQQREIPEGSRSLTVKEFTVQLIPAAFVPVYYDPSAFSDDKVTIELTPKGFLKQVNVDVEDKSGEFITKLADLGIGIAKLATQYPASTLKIVGEEVTQEIRFVLDPYQEDARTLDPIPGQSIDDIKISVETLGASRDTFSSDNRLTPMAELDERVTKRCSVQVCYPALIAKKVTFSGPTGTNEDRLVIVPDPRHLVTIDLRRASLVKKALVADFSDGMLTKIVLSKPSEALGVIQVPLDIVEKLISLPTELVQLKIDTTEKQTDLLQAQKDLLEAQASLIEAIEKAKEEEAKRRQTENNPYGGSN